MEARVERPPGRPRSGEADRRILAVALSHLRNLGYARMSMEHVAAEAGVGKATIYRRYANKADLATAALADLVESAFAEPPPEGTREALVDHLRRFERAVAGGGLEVLAALVGRGSDPELLALHRERIVTRAQARLTAILERARDRGEIRAEADLATAIHMLVGSYFARHVAGGNAAGWAETTVDTLMRGLAR